jgi:hypothetical protein
LTLSVGEANIAEGGRGDEKDGRGDEKEGRGDEKHERGLARCENVSKGTANVEGCGIGVDCETCFGGATELLDKGEGTWVG